MQQQEEIKLKVGDKVRVEDHPFVGTREGVVTHTTSRDVCVEFPGWSEGHNGDFADFDRRVTCRYFWNHPTYDHYDHISVLLPVNTQTPTVASDLRLTPQAKTVLQHLRRRKSISPAEALISHGISRLASCIHEIRRRAGYDVAMEIHKDDQGHKYARYKLATVH